MKVEQVCEGAVNQTKEDLLSLNKTQMFDGKTKTGQDITPSYLDDPYFKSRESAQRYSDWKDSITPNPKRKKGTPNLFIVGTYHNSLEIKVGNGQIDTRSSFVKASSIEAKFGGDIYGLGGEYKEEYIGDNLAPAVGRALVQNLNKK